MSKIIHGDLVGITISKLIASVGRGLVVVFIPLLLLDKGMALWQVCGFYVCYSVCKLLVNYPSALLINQRGARLGLLVGTTAAASFMVVMSVYIAAPSLGLVVVMALLMALQNSFCWNSEHLYISRAMSMERKSRDLATIESCMRIAGIATPALGGLIVVTTSQLWLTIIAAAILFLSLVPIWRIDRLAGGHRRDSELKYSLRSAPTRDTIANFGFNAHTLVGVMVWPMYMAVFISNFSSIGLIATIASLIAVIVLQVVAHRADKGQVYRVLVEGTAGSSVVHVLRVAASSNPVSIAVIAALYDIVLGYQQNPWASLYYAHARKGGINYIMSMEIAGDLAYVVMWGVLGLVAFFVPGTTFFTVAFGLAAVLAWLCLFMRKEHAAAPAAQVPVA